jgi:hypothetical protein
MNGTAFVGIAAYMGQAHHNKGSSGPFCDSIREAKGKKRTPATPAARKEASAAAEKMVKARMTTADVAAEVKCLRRLIGMRLSNVYDLTPKVAGLSLRHAPSPSPSLLLASNPSHGTWNASCIPAFRGGE